MTKRSAIAAIVLGAVSAAAIGQSAPSADPAGAKVTTADIAVYDAVMASWFGKDNVRQLVNRELQPAPSATSPGTQDCSKGVDFSADAGSKSESRTLAGVKFSRTGIELVDGSQWTPTDPGEAIASGKSVDAAVRDGFAHSLMSFSQVRFSRDGTDAMVSFGVVCGSLCGSGATLRLHKTASKWEIVKRCEQWVS